MLSNNLPEGVLTVNQSESEEVLEIDDDDEDEAPKPKRTSRAAVLR
jgi:hypothetical protein